MFGDLRTDKLVPVLQIELCKIHVSHTSNPNHFTQSQWQDVAPGQTFQEILARYTLTFQTSVLWATSILPG